MFTANLSNFPQTLQMALQHQQQNLQQQLQSFLLLQQQKQQQQQQQQNAAQAASAAAMLQSQARRINMLNQGAPSLLKLVSSWKCAGKLKSH